MCNRVTHSPTGAFYDVYPNTDRQTDRHTQSEEPMGEISFPALLRYQMPTVNILHILQHYTLVSEDKVDVFYSYV